MSAFKLDTNVCIYLLGMSGAERKKAADTFIAGKKCMVHDIVLIELEYFLRKNLGLARSEVAQNLRALVNTFPVIGYVSDEVVRDYERFGSVSFVDIILCASAAVNKSKLITHDKELLKKYPYSTVKLDL